VLSPLTAWGHVASRRESTVSGGACLPFSWAERARRCEADRGRQVPYRCLDRLVRARNRTSATTTPTFFAAAFLRRLRLPADHFECLPKQMFAHIVLGRACRVLAVLKTMTGDDTAGGTGAQGSDASFCACDGAFLAAASIPQATPIWVIASGILSAARMLRQPRPVKGEMF